MGETIGTLVDGPAHVIGEQGALVEIQHALLDGAPAVAVVDAAGALCGVITSTDLLAAGDDWSAADAMSSAVSAFSHAAIDDVADAMARARAAHVVVTDAAGQVVGIVTAHAIARHRAKRAGCSMFQRATSRLSRGTNKA